MRTFTISLLLAAGTLSCFADPEFVKGPSGVTIRIAGVDYTEVRYGKDAHKPYLSALRTPSGKLITRGFSNSPEAGGGKDEHHQGGVWVGHGQVSGVDFFEVDPGSSKSRPAGSQVFKELTFAGGVARHGSGRNYIVSFVDDWVRPDGGTVITEQRAYRFAGDRNDDYRIVDVEFKLHANQKLELTDSKECLFGLRLAEAFEERNGGVVKDLLGRQGASALNGLRLLWVGYEATVDGEQVALTIMDHPDNYGFPTRWHVDERGFVFATPFAERSYYPEGKTPPPGVKDMGVTLEPGEEMVFRYRILIHPLSLNRQACWRQFALAPASNYTDAGITSTK